jgi:hypothetical protein
MCVNAGGDPGRDDYGLPPVDIEVPDDARELARDVQAYHRELRSLRRRRVARRFYGPLTRDGMVLPLLAGCLALTLIAATLLTVITARRPMVSLRPAQPAARQGAALVHTILFAAGQPTPLNSLPGPVVVLALVPPGCRCLPDLQDLTYQASKARALIYLVGVRDTSVTALAAQLGLGASHGLEDSTDSLPPPYKVAALTAVLVRPDGSADPVVIHKHGHGFQIENDVRALIPAGLAGPASASPGAPSAGATPSGTPSAGATPSGRAAPAPAAGTGSAASGAPAT